jgi:hypothetical protein
VRPSRCPISPSVERSASDSFKRPFNWAGLPPAPERKRTTTWSAFIRTHLALLAGTDFFTAEVLTLRGLMTYYVLFFIHL